MTENGQCKLALCRDGTKYDVLNSSPYDVVN